jgi:soluble lytic murein transglycosylase
MIKQYLKRFILAASCLTIVSVSAATEDEPLLKAQDAYDKENAAELAKYVNQLEASNDMLAPYAKYWLMRLTLDTIDNKVISDFIAQHEDFAFAERLRVEYLKKLGKQQDWENFNQAYIKNQSENISVACYAAEAYAKQPTTSSLLFAKPLWLSAKERPNDCTRLFDILQKVGVIDEEAVWQRFRMALAHNRVNLAKSISKRSQYYRSSYRKQLTSVSKSPKKALKKKRISLKTRFGRELSLYALTRVAKKDTWEALALFKSIQNKLNAGEQSHFYGMLGLFASKRHEPEAQLWFQKADFESLNEEQMSWFARAALRQQDWAGLLNVLERMPTTISNQARWRYWKGRALIERKHPEEGIAILRGLAPERHYYGWLAQDEIKGYRAPKLQYQKVPFKEVERIGKLPGVKRAEALLDLDLRWEGKSEWVLATKGMSDQQLLAAAEYANRQQWYDLAINTADNTKEYHDYSLRYLMPYQGLMRQAALKQNVDLTWVHGIVRQESRFMHYAKSRVGAAGLMQLMPTTARWAAKRAGVKNYERSMIDDLDTNVTIGTYYLRYTLDLMKGNKVMASAGYNAGPSRAKKWQGKEPLEGAIYAETIPFNETRNYVQRVIANAQLYGKQLGDKHTTLKQRMGVIPAKR